MGHVTAAFNHILVDGLRRVAVCSTHPLSELVGLVDHLVFRDVLKGSTLAHLVALPLEPSLGLDKLDLLLHLIVYFIGPCTTPVRVKLLLLCILLHLSGVHVIIDHETSLGLL